MAKMVNIVINVIKNKITLLVCFLLGFAYYFPRVLSDHLGEDHYLSSYLYIYAFGIIFFILNMRLLIHSRALNLKREGEKKWMWFFIACLVWGIGMHGLWIFAAVHFPFKGLV